MNQRNARHIHFFIMAMRVAHANWASLERRMHDRAQKRGRGPRRLIRQYEDLPYTSLDWVADTAFVKLY